MAATNQFRIFISLPVATTVKEEIRRVQNELRTQLPGDAVRWTRPEQVHLTLKFLGNIAAEEVQGLVAALREAGSKLAPIVLRAEGLGFFPPRGISRVLWMGVRDEGGTLQQLQRQVEMASRRINPAVGEERFKEHLTIGRAKNLRAMEGRTLTILAQQYERKIFGSWQADAVEVMRSELSSSGSRYTCLAEIPLRGDL